MYYNAQETKKNLKPGLVASYDIWPGNGGAYSYFGAHKFVTYLLI